jgi:hypothetical protein
MQEKVFLTTAGRRRAGSCTRLDSAALRRRLFETMRSHQWMSSGGDISNDCWAARRPSHPSRYDREILRQAVNKVLGATGWRTPGCADLTIGPIAETVDRRRPLCWSLRPVCKATERVLSDRRNVVLCLSAEHDRAHLRPQVTKLLSEIAGADPGPEKGAAESPWFTTDICGGRSISNVFC